MSRTFEVSEEYIAEKWSTEADLEKAEAALSEIENTLREKMDLITIGDLLNLIDTMIGIAENWRER